MKELDAAGIPTVHIATITPISEAVGANRIVKGVSIPHPTGEVGLDPEEEKKRRKEQIREALNLLAAKVQGAEQEP